MKMKKLFLTAAAVAAVAVCATAQTTIKAMACTDLALSGTAATGTGTMSYQWYSGATAAACTTAVAGCATQNCTIPAANAINTVVYKRVVVSSNCPADIKETTTITVQYQGLKLGTVCWAPVNVGNTGRWSEKPDDYGGFFQFNRKQAWHPTEPAAGIAIPGWITSINEDSDWNETTNAVCPTGWRLPTNTESQDLHDASTTGSTSTAGTWAGITDKGNAVTGRFYGPNHLTCSLPDNMEGCIFLPASGNRNGTTGALNNQGTYGGYWSSVQSSTTNGYYLNINSTSSNPANNFNKANGFSVRCVKSM
jgi:uncharacterized protein (TIGR02145 family)